MSKYAKDFLKRKEMQTEDDIITFDELYRSYTLKALHRARSIKGAAKLLGVSVRTVLRWKKAYGIRRCPTTYEYYQHPLKA